MGAKGTPYGHGAFLYDIYFDENYPNMPPKVNLTTTGSARVRFNPNLYHNGKVCLSLLGTWTGKQQSEKWNPKLSTILQVLMSIQAIIMSEDVYFNEPGYEHEAGTPLGEQKNEAYANIVKYCNIKYAMIDQIKFPPKGFEEIIKRHFYLKKAEILRACNKWIKIAESGKRKASYTGLINSHNNKWCKVFQETPNTYARMLKEAVNELKTELDKIPPPKTANIKINRRKKKRKMKSTKRLEVIDINKQQANLEEIDVTYDEKIVQKKLDV